VGSAGDHAAQNPGARLRAKAAKAELLAAQPSVTGPGSKSQRKNIGSRPRIK